MDHNEAHRLVYQGRLQDIKNEDELHSGLAALHLYYASNPNAHWIKASIEAYENEIGRRQKERHQEDSKTLHQQQIELGKALHGETMGEMAKLKISVDQLARARCVDKWILVAGWIAAIAAVVAVVLALFLRH